MRLSFLVYEFKANFQELFDVKWPKSMWDNMSGFWRIQVQNLLILQLSTIPELLQKTHQRSIGDRYAGSATDMTQRRPIKEHAYLNGAPGTDMPHRKPIRDRPVCQETDMPHRRPNRHVSDRAYLSPIRNVGLQWFFDNNYIFVNEGGMAAPRF